MSFLFGSPLYLCLPSTCSHMHTLISTHSHYIVVISMRVWFFHVCMCFCALALNFAAAVAITVGMMASKFVAWGFIKTSMDSDQNL